MKLFMKLFDFLAMGFCLGLAINLTIIFFIALFNEGGVLVLIDQFYEKEIEMIAFPIFIVMGIITLIRMGRRLGKKYDD